MSFVKIISVLVVMGGFFPACSEGVQSHTKDFEVSEDGWTLVRRVGGQDSLTTAPGAGAQVDGKYITKRGSGVVVYGPYQRTYGLARFDLDAQVRMKITWEGQHKKTCSRRSGDTSKCALKGCPKVHYACDQGPGRVMIDVAMNHPTAGFGKFSIGSRVIEVGHGSESRDFAIDDFMIMENQDLDYLEFRVITLDDWMKVDVEEMRLTAKLIYK